MKSKLIAIVAAVVVVVVVGCGPSLNIHEAAFRGSIEAVKQAIADGADVNAKSSRKGSTPLHSAAFDGHKEIAELLIANGADVNAKIVILGTPLDWAIKYKRNETADLLRKHGGKTRKELKAEGK
jgi:ankyrin repeat protein